MQSEERSTKFRTFVKAWTEANLAAVDEVMAPNVIYHIPPFPDLSDAGSVKQFIASFNQAFPDDFHISFDEDLVAGNTTVHRWTGSGTFKGESPLLPVPPTGNHTKAFGVHLCRWDGDKCVDVWHFGDWLSWLTGAGVIAPLDRPP